MRVYLLVLTVALTPLVVTLGGCITPSDGYPGGGGWTGSGGRPLSGCQSDHDCGGLVCARDETCQQASNIHPVHVTWTLRGKPADVTTCTHSADLEIQFRSDARDQLGFAPVPCRAGKFTIDKLPIWYNVVDLSISGGGNAALINPSTGDAMIDLPY